MTTEQLQLGEVIELAYGASLPKRARRDGDVPVYGSNGVTGWHDTPLVHEPTIIVGRKGSAGAVHFVDRPSFPIDTTYFVRVKSGYEIDLPFLYQLLSRLNLSRLAVTTGVPGLNRADAYREVILIPPLPEQRRIVDLLDRGTSLKRLAEQAQAKAHELSSALFIDMFGDPATNPKGWPVMRVGELADRMSDGPFGSNLKSEHYTDHGVRVWRLQNVGVGRLDDRDKAFISNAHFRSLIRHTCAPGDVIVGTLGDPNLRAFVQPETVALAINNADCVQIRCSSAVAVPEYVAALMNQPGMLLLCQRQITGQTRARISMGRLREVPVPVPPVSLQATFASRVAEINSCTELAERAAITAEKASAALMSRLFAT